MKSNPSARSAKGSTEAIGTLNTDELSSDEKLLLGIMMVDPEISPPTDSEWRALIGALRFFAHRRRQGYRNQGLSAEQTWCASYTNCLAQFFLNHPVAKDMGLQSPFALLTFGFNDLASGKVPDLFKSTTKRSNRPPDQQVTDIIKGQAARALHLAIISGEEPRRAADRIARALRASGVRGARRIGAATIQNWRARCMEGTGTMSAVTLAHFTAELPDAAGHTPGEQSDFILNNMRNAQALRE